MNVFAVYFENFHFKIIGFSDLSAVSMQYS